MQTRRLRRNRTLRLGGKAGLVGDGDPHRAAGEKTPEGLAAGVISWDLKNDRSRLESSLLMVYGFD